MKKAILILSFLTLASCGEDSNKTQQIAENLSIFNIQALELNEIEDKNSLIGLWQTDEFEQNGITMQVRWQVTETETRMAKKCTNEDGLVYYAQISAPVETEIVTTNNVTTSSVQISLSDKIQEIIEMPDGKICQVVIDPAIGDNQNIIESGGEFSLTSQNITAGRIGLLFTEEARNGNLTKIRD